MKITLIAAVAENGVIGRDNALPWHLPEDLRRFKRRTEGHIVIMGRRTFESVGQPLPRRRSIVITRRHDFQRPGAEIAHSLEEAFQRARESNPPEIFILGGAEIYALALPAADCLELTVVHADVAGDTFFPECDLSEWALVADERHEADDRHAYAFSFRVYERKRRD
jgi:dihydrofolate reductase